ncbi:3-oxoacyl-ACP synthase III family protein [Rhodohalobacter sp. 614A]|uniref:3-oxoacyl-ACP synthase III family protein n=1 Tax=Rhodohalobacter sp. 614A TaxID=2908649 RepID=UPI001F447A15|nr:beta-ketoacyl-ACP synthase III [Rhodohalobacter sp. 614A]
MRSLNRRAKITGTGSYLPSKTIKNSDLHVEFASKDSWIQKNLGIKERRIADPSEATSDLAAKAGQRAIESAGLTPPDIDLIIVATTTPDRPAPSTACIVQEKIGAFNAAAFDLAAVCSGFLYGMTVANQFIATKMYEHILVIGVDVFSRITDWERRDCIFFGDGAGAAVFSPAGDSEGFLNFRLHADGRGKFHFTIPAGGSEIPATPETLDKRLHFFEMNGRAVYETATKVLPEVILEVLDDAHLTVDDIKLVIPHQPSIKVLKEVARIINMPFEKVMTNMAHYANTSGGTIPILLDEVVRAGKINKGDLILFAAVGSGWTWGASILKWA